MKEDLEFLTKQSATWVWLLLVGVTLASWWVGTDNAELEGDAAKQLATVLLLIAFVKCRLVIRHFMEVRHAGFVLRVATDLWCAIVLVAILWSIW